MDTENLNDVENVLFQDWGDKYIADALRIVATKTMGPLDNEVVYEAMCIIVAMYMQKVKDGKINQNKVLH